MTIHGPSKRFQLQTARETQRKKRTLLTLACFISSSAISMRFFLKATTRLPLKLVSSEIDCCRKTVCSVSNILELKKQLQNKSVSLIRVVSNQGRRLENVAGKKGTGWLNLICPTDSNLLVEYHRVQCLGHRLL